jgi:hypothetical protein
MNHILDPSFLCNSRKDRLSEKNISRHCIISSLKQEIFIRHFLFGVAISEFPDPLIQLNLDPIWIRNTCRYSVPVPVHTCLIRPLLGLGPIVPSSRLTWRKKI